MNSTNWKAHVGQRLLVRPSSLLSQHDCKEVKLLEIAESGTYLLFEYPGAEQHREWKETRDWKLIEVLLSVSEADMAVRIMRLVHELRAGDGWSVEIMCDNPDPRYVEEAAAVNVSNDFTWSFETQDKRFEGRDLEDALTQAVKWVREELRKKYATA